MNYFEVRAANGRVLFSAMTENMAKTFIRERYYKTGELTQLFEVSR